MPDYVVEFGRIGAPLPDGRLDAPAFHRNAEPIWSALAPFLAGLTSDLLDIGSGTGQHAAAFAPRVPALTWWPSDIAASHLASIDAWRVHSGAANLRPPVKIDLTAPDWDLGPRGLPTKFAAIFCANVLHIAPWAAAEGLLTGAARHLRADGRLFVYGPFKRDGHFTADSNAAFDLSLRQGNPEWGVRDTADLAALAARVGLRLADCIAMPANNFILVFASAAPSSPPA
jgi:SAM-dependent methyltransferase